MPEISINFERSEYVLFSFPHTITSVTYVTTPPKMVKHFKYLYGVFDEWTWILLLSTFVVYMSMFIFSKSLFKFYWTVVEIFLQQASNFRNTQSTKIRVLFLTLMLACSNLSTIYSNLLYSLSVSPSKPEEINTILKLIAKSLTGEIEVTSFSDTSSTDLIMVISK